ncbi:MAG: O-methyltransferase [Giesbergeria sp.]
MTASFKRIDYSLRPAKHAERRMLCDVFRRLKPFGRVEDYVYVGFGSIWFADFTLMHRSLGIKDMISIEQEKSAQARIDDNKPFRIPVDYRESKHALPDLSWTKKQFLWLDYDDPLSMDVLLDLRTVVMRAGSGTVLTISVQCQKAPQYAEAEQDKVPDSPNAIERFITTFGRDRIPPGTSAKNLVGWPFGALSRAILLQEIDAALAVRNSVDAGAEMCRQLICEIEYEDGAKMATISVIFYSQQDKPLVEQCHFDGLDFLPNPLAPVRIVVPKLTGREFKKLESQLPLRVGEQLVLGTIPQTDANHFVKMYRYLPNFAVLEG